MGIGLGEEFYAAGVVELLQEFDDLRGVVFELLDGTAGERDGALEVAAILLGHVDEGIEGGDVRAFGRLADGAGVLVVVVVVVVGTDVEETIALEMDVLVNLKI